MAGSNENGDTTTVDTAGVSGFLPIRDWSRPAKVRAVALLLVLIVASWGFVWNTYWRTPKLGGPSEIAGPGAGFNGFDVSNAIIPKEKILRGGPPRDGIPAILEPKFAPASEVVYLKDTDEVLGFVRGDVARAYPLRILVWHEIANDTVGGVPIAATYCPLCGTCMVFDRRIDGDTLTFGVSGLLYQSDVLMYDHETESLWSQLKMEAVSGEHVGTALPWIESKQMTWAAWKDAYPDSEVLSPDTGYARDYGGEAYARYKGTDRVMFPVPTTRTELRAKAWVIGIIVDGQAKAYPLEVLKGLDAPLLDSLGDHAIVVAFDAESEHAQITTEQGEPIPSVHVYWFAWQAFYPDTLLYAP